MTHFMINGVEKDTPTLGGNSLGDLIHYVNQTLATETGLISSVRVDGIEVSAFDDVELAKRLLSEIGSVEIITTHPREMAEETLQTLRLFMSRLSESSKSINLSNELVGNDKLAEEAEFRKLVDGLETVVETITTVRGVLRIGLLQEVNILEADLLSILKDLLEARQNGDILYIQDLLREHLPLNLEEWQTIGIPAMIKSRDS